MIYRCASQLFFGDDRWWNSDDHDPGRTQLPGRSVIHQSKTWSFWGGTSRCADCHWFSPFQVPTSWVATQLNSRLVQPIFFPCHHSTPRWEQHSTAFPQECLYNFVHLETSKWKISMGMDRLNDERWFLPRKVSQRVRLLSHHLIDQRAIINPPDQPSTTH